MRRRERSRCKDYAFQRPEGGSGAVYASLDVAALSLPSGSRLEAPEDWRALQSLRRAKAPGPNQPRAVGRGLGYPSVRVDDPLPVLAVGDVAGTVSVTVWTARRLSPPWGIQPGQWLRQGGQHMPVLVVGDPARTVSLTRWTTHCWSSPWGTRPKQWL